MSLFSWFTRKSAPARPRPVEPSGMFNAEATVPLMPGRNGKSQLDVPPPEHAANRKNERMERRELLYAVAETVVDEVLASGKTSPELATRTGEVEEEGCVEA